MAASFVLRESEGYALDSLREAAAVEGPCHPHRTGARCAVQRGFLLAYCRSVGTKLVAIGGAQQALCRCAPANPGLRTGGYRHRGSIHAEKLPTAFPQGRPALPDGERRPFDQFRRDARSNHGRCRPEPARLVARRSRNRGIPSKSTLSRHQNAGLRTTAPAPAGLSDSAATAPAACPAPLRGPDRRSAAHTHRLRGRDGPCRSPGANT